MSGTVIATGPQASRWRVGDQVCALTPGGGYAQYRLADERHCLPVPRGMDLLTAAAIPENYYTVWTMFERARLAAGERFLVHGGSSGIGLTAIQLARLRRRSLDHGGQRREGGGLHRGRRAARADLPRHRLRGRHPPATGGQGVDVILDMVGGAYSTRTSACWR